MIIFICFILVFTAVGFVGYFISHKSIETFKLKSFEYTDSVFDLLLETDTYTSLNYEYLNKSIQDMELLKEANRKQYEDIVITMYARLTKINNICNRFTHNLHHKDALLYIRPYLKRIFRKSNRLILFYRHKQNDANLFMDFETSLEDEDYKN